jgi:hypothetical protein
MTTTETPAAKVVPVLGMYAPFARDKLAKLAKRAARYGQTITWTETKRTEETRRVRPDGVEEKVVVERVDFAVVGEAPRVGDFKFLASIERLEGGVLVSAIGGVEIGEKAYDWDGSCEHCRKPRNRAYGFVVEGPDGERLIVGKSCLRDFTGCDVPAGAISLFQYLREFGSGEEGDSWGGGGRWVETTKGVIATTRAAIALWGWRPSSQEGMTTSTYVNLAYGPISYDRQTGKPHNDTERKALEAELAARCDLYAAEAEKIVDWGCLLSPRGDYEHNLKVALAGEWVSGKTFNLVVSACAAYDRQVAREDEVAAKRKAEAEALAALPPSDWVGQVGQRVDFGEVLVERVMAMPDNGYGPSQLYKFRTDKGEALAWFSASFPTIDGEPIRANDRVRLVATVKDHKTFNDRRETALTRAKMAKAVAEAA